MGTTPPRFLTHQCNLNFYVLCEAIDSKRHEHKRIVAKAQEEAKSHAMTRQTLDETHNTLDKKTQEHYNQVVEMQTEVSVDLFDSRMQSVTFPCSLPMSSDIYTVHSFFEIHFELSLK